MVIGCFLYLMIQFNEEVKDYDHEYCDCKSLNRLFINPIH